MKLRPEDIRGKKKQGERIVALTSYDYPTAVVEDACGVDIQLVGDSVGTNVLGYTDVSQVTVQDMVHHVKAVVRGAAHSLVVCDMPFGSFASADTALSNARTFLAAGADAVKMEGEYEVLDQARHLSASGVPVCAHIGYTPQTDGARASVQGKDIGRAVELIRIARELEKAGAFMMVLELLPEQLAKEITAMLTIPTIGIGAGRYCDGQVQVVHDILGLSARVYRHARAFAALRGEYAKAVESYAAEVRSGGFPTAHNAAQLPDDVLSAVRQWLAQHPAGQ